MGIAKACIKWSDFDKIQYKYLEMILLSTHNSEGGGGNYRKRKTQNYDFFIKSALKIFIKLCSNLTSKAL